MRTCKTCRFASLQQSLESTLSSLNLSIYNVEPASPGLNNLTFARESCTKVAGTLPEGVNRDDTEGTRKVTDAGNTHFMPNAQCI
eukprot:gene20503-biopygen5586